MFEDDLIQGVVWYAVLLVSLVFHEAAHAFTAWRLGDRTALEGGQVSLNPLPHILREPLGMIVLPWLSYSAWGWMIGWASTPYDVRWARTYPKRAALMFLSGPAANLLLALAAAGCIRLGTAAELFYPPEVVNYAQVTSGCSDGLPYGLSVLVSILFSLNLAMFLFNMMPVPPLDGRAWLELLLPATWRRYYQSLMSFLPVRLTAFLLAWFLLGWILRPAFVGLLNLIYWGYPAFYG
ncbi:MAG TPA: site-2 protease family protein [Anaerohalosphaeraceae bacterium]|nr:site-2 protease family protein [Anaerohalosphaeraceae bacterium]HPB93170.1 site-2 protease family protein [Anaerohalosphaeraceae bacterium]HRT22561.1 site-2 protease family protein [Anaerohalosphaeraceae bacterium]HRU14270.1 site-2 protease family protein [Anaerohalosphaeraceae bacterium]